MKLKIYLVLIVFISVLITVSCNDNGSESMKSISGKPGECLVVISKESWEGTPGKLIKEVLGKSHVSLPQEEPLFDLINVPHEAFKSILRSTRNVLQVNISQNLDKEDIEFKDNAWAYPQATVQINAKSIESFERIFNENQNKLLSYFLLAERKILTSTYNKLYENSIFNVLDTEFGVTMKVSPGFKIAKKTKDAIWLRYETNEISQGILLFTTPYADSTFTINNLINNQDTVLKANIPGPIANSYMKTERRIDQVFNLFEHNKNYASEIRGLWTLEKGYMGGPFILLSELDASNNRVINAYGYVYAPSKDKRNLLRQVEAMIYSLKMKKQAENDKIKSQINMGN